MNPVFIIIILLVLHFVSDFALQPRWMGKQKSKSNLVLLVHCGFYSLVFLAAGHGFAVNYPELVPKLFGFTGITFVTHFIVDYFTSRLGSKLWNEGKEYESLLVLGFDQLLHGVQLILTYYFLFQ